MIHFLTIVYMLSVAGLALYGLIGLITLGLYWHHRHESFPLPEVPALNLPPVTVQLPIYNERFVVERLIKAAVALDYPADRLQIQVIDDSTDDTTQIAGELVNHYQDQGINIQLLHRDHRQGYKAGALSKAGAEASGEFLVIFDADFQPPAEFLKNCIPHFIGNPSLGMVQTRWSHLNAADTPLTAAQAMALDKHFVIEQSVRHRADLFPKFNGAGGIWRRECLQDSGGWEADTVCEDLCLSTRAILKGWRFLYLNDVTAPAELPVTVTAFKNQQARWAKGSIQCLGKYGKAILKDPGHSIYARLYALLSMFSYVTYFLMVLLLLIQVPLLYFDTQFTPRILIFSLLGIGQPLLFILSQQILYPDWRKKLRHFLTMLLVAIGSSPNIGRAILQAIFGRHHPFIRTPKGSGIVADLQERYKLPFDRIILVEMALSLYALIGLIFAIQHGHIASLFFLISCVFGFGFVAFLGISEAKQD